MHLPYCSKTRIGENNWNRTRAKAEILAAAGADIAREAADVFTHSATVFLMLVDGGAIDTVLDRGGACFAARASPRHCSMFARRSMARRGRSVSVTLTWLPFSRPSRHAATVSR